MDYPSVYLKRGRDYPVRRGHPWVFSGAINRMDPGIEGAGELVAVRSCDGDLLGVGSLNTRGAVAIRMWAWGEAQVDEGFFRERIERAASLRRSTGFAVEGEESACRVVYGESDGLPGIIVDKYGKVLVLQVFSAGGEHLRDALIAALASAFPGCSIYERSDGPARTRAGLDPRCGPVLGPPPEGPVRFQEDGAVFFADVVDGQKTGFYLDQRPNRRAVAEFTASACRGKERYEVLNVFSYTGAFGIAAARAGENVFVTNIDSSSAALVQASRQAEANAVRARFSTLEGNAFHVLRQFRDSRREFDMIVLDPPRFATSPASVNDACRGYKDLNLLAIKLLRPGGALFTFSCSGRVDPVLFRKVVSAAAQDAARRVLILKQLHQSPDHPVPLSFPEADYLKGLLCVVE